MWHTLSIAALSLMLSACVTPAVEPDTAAVAAEATAPQPIDRDTVAAVAETVVIPTRPIPDDSVYALLVAEFALRRRNYPVALQYYMEQAALLRDPNVSAHTTRLAQFMHREDEALIAATLWVELQPDNLEARRTLGSLLTHKHRPAEALPHLAVLAKAGGRATFAQLALGYDDLPAAQKVTLLAAMDTLQLELPEDIQLMIARAVMLETLGQKDLALEVLRGVFRLQHDQLQAAILEAKLAQELGAGAEAFSRLGALLEEQPENDQLRLQYARLLTRYDLSLALKQFEMLVEKSPNDPNLLFSLALINREVGNLNTSRVQLQSLVNKGQRVDEAHYYLGRLAEQQNRYDDAVLEYMQVADSQDFATANNRLASILVAAGKTVELQEYFDELRGRYPRRAAQLYAIEVDKQVKANALEQAMHILGEALQALPQNTSLQYTRSMVSEQLGDLVQAEADLRAIIDREPNNATALNALGYTLANKTERYTEAHELIDRALRLSPGEPAILDSMGWVQYRLGENDQALNYLRQAYALFPDPEVAAHLGEVLWAMGQLDDAREVWRAALAINPEDGILLEVMRRLDVMPP